MRSVVLVSCLKSEAISLSPTPLGLDPSSRARSTHFITTSTRKPVPRALCFRKTRLTCDGIGRHRAGDDESTHGWLPLNTPSCTPPSVSVEDPVRNRSLLQPLNTPSCTPPSVSVEDPVRNRSLLQPLNTPSCTSPSVSVEDPVRHRSLLQPLNTPSCTSPSVSVEDPMRPHVHSLSSVQAAY